MNTSSCIRPLASAISLAILCALASGCQSNINSTLPVVETVTPIAQTERFCPVTGEPVTELDEHAFFETYPVYCKGRENARQFASLSATQRARLAKEQVLPQKGISNTSCPLTGETLTAAASPVVYEGQVVGFASLADANQFRSLNAEKKAKLIARWKAEQASESNG
jgi:hypothetical protein